MNRRRFAELAHQATRGHLCQLHALCGDRYAADRAALLSALTGEKVVKSKAGINRLMDEAFRAFPVGIGECPAVRWDLLADAIRAELPAGAAA